MQLTGRRVGTFRLYSTVHRGSEDQVAFPLLPITNAEASLATMPLDAQRCPI